MDGLRAIKQGKVCGMEKGSDQQLKAIGKMLNPRSIAVVGASPKGGYGGRLLTKVLLSKDRVPVYPVNPNYDEIMGVRAYRSLADLPEAPDLVGVVVPYQKVLGVLQECVDKKAGSALIISAGFAERATDEGRDLQRQIGVFAKTSGLRIAGPNCLGLANVKDSIWATAASGGVEGLPGHIGLICQSGATAFGPFVVHAQDNGIGFSHIISTGNEADLDFADFARYLVDDEATHVIAGFVEGFKDVRKFLAVAELAAARGKPIVLIKIGRSEAGARAARSHTASLTGADAMYEAVFKQYGVIRVQDYDELLEISHMFAHIRRPPKTGVAVVSHSGGISSLTADMCGQAGLELPPLSQRASDGLNAILKGFGGAGNPADVTGKARSDVFPQIMDYLINEPEVGTLVVASRGPVSQADQVIALRDRSEKALAYLWTGSRADKTGLPALKAAHIPIFYSPEKLARALASLIAYHRWRERRATEGPPTLPPPTAEQEQAIAQLSGVKQTALSESASRKLIAAWGVQGPTERQVQSVDAAVAAAQDIGYPVALKVDSSDILHKTEAGVVRLNLRDADAVRNAYAEVIANAACHAPKAKISGVLVQEMISGGVEVIVGVSYDAQLGAMLLFGSGGVTVEVYNDVALRHCPVSRAEALNMIAEVKGAKLLRGFRGQPPADIDALADMLVRISNMALHLEGRIAELDINPLMVLPAGKGGRAADALVVLKS
jgi:acetate---CoA ligase (ADP-forming)